MEISCQHFVDLEVQISWQLQHFVNLEVQILWQAQHFVNLDGPKIRRNMNSWRSRMPAGGYVQHATFVDVFPSVGQPFEYPWPMKTDHKVTCRHQVLFSHCRLDAVLKEAAVLECCICICPFWTSVRRDAPLISWPHPLLGIIEHWNCAFRSKKNSGRTHLRISHKFTSLGFNRRLPLYRLLPTPSIRPLYEQPGAAALR